MTATISNNAGKILKDVSNNLGMSESDLIEKCVQYIGLSSPEDFSLMNFTPGKTEDFIHDFRKTNKYSEDFLGELEDALNESQINTVN